MPITPELLDELLKDYKSPEDMFGDDGLLQQLTKAVVERLWNDFGEDSITSIANGCRCMAEIWESAWDEGGGPNIPHSKLKAISKDLLASIYRPQSFLPSRALKDMGPLLQ